MGEGYGRGVWGWGMGVGYGGRVWNAELNILERKKRTRRFVLETGSVWLI